MLLALLGHNTLQAAFKFLRQDHAGQARIGVCCRHERGQIALGLRQWHRPVRALDMALPRFVNELSQLLSQFAVPTPRLMRSHLHRHG